MGELAEEGREGGGAVGAKDCSKGFGSRSKFDRWGRERESLESEVAVASGRGCCFC